MKTKKLLGLTLTVIAALLVAVAIPVFASGTNVEPNGGISGVNVTENDPLLRVEYCTLSLESDAHIMYAIRSNDPNLKLLTWMKPQSNYTLGTEESVLTPLSERTEINGEMYTVFKFTGFSAKQMTDDIYVRAYIEDGNGNITYGTPHKYSILQYAYNMLGKTSEYTADEMLTETLTKMLEFGAATQKNFGYKTDTLATDEWVQVKLTGGSLPDGFNKGLYIPGTALTLTAPEKNGSKEVFKHWEDGNGNTVSKVREFSVTAGDANAVYTPVYEPIYARDDIYIYFGSYPQSEVTDSALEAELNALTGELPVNGDSKAWTSYKYYNAGSNETDFMWYQDITLENECYRGVYFSTARPSYTIIQSPGSDNEQGYYADTVYWFKFEPIKWRILAENNGAAFLLCDMLIDAQQYYKSNSEVRYVNGAPVHTNNYEYSDIRAWLNDQFYNTAFTSLQQELILATEVDNSLASTGFTSDKYQLMCNNTTDKIFLPSIKEITTEAYGFHPNQWHTDDRRFKTTTDYAQSQGAWTYRGGDYNGCGQWWLRSPSNEFAYVAMSIYYSSTAAEAHVHCSGYSVCPALWIML